MTVLGVVCGLEAEARIARRWGVLVAVGGGTEAGATQAAERLAPRVGGLISFGIAGGLDPGLQPGDILVPATIRAGDEAWRTDDEINGILGGGTGHVVRGGGDILATPEQKAAAFAEGAHAVDLESAPVARAATRRSLPFATLRAVCDPAHHALPPAVPLALDPAGRIMPLRFALAVLARPGQVPALIALARDAARANAALRRRVGQTRLAGPTGPA